MRRTLTQKSQHSAPEKYVLAWVPGP